MKQKKPPPVTHNWQRLRRAGVSAPNVAGDAFSTRVGQTAKQTGFISFFFLRIIMPLIIFTFVCLFVFFGFF
jgi:hypothetical protein